MNQQFKKKLIYPKLEKGPDLFVKVANILKNNKYPNLKVVLTGERRQYVIRELDKLGIEYYYFEMCDLEKLNQLYNCLDLYIISARVEGGPRSINECALTKTPLLTTDVGMSDIICYPESIYDMKKLDSVLECKYDVEYNYKKIVRLNIDNFMKIFNSKVFNL